MSKYIFVWLLKQDFFVQLLKNDFEKKNIVNFGNKIAFTTKHINKLQMQKNDVNS